MKTIPLTSHGKKIVAFAKVDDDCYFSLANFRWHLDSWGYAQRSENLGNGKYKSYKMHRLIAGLVHGDKRFVDHINRNKLDNRKSNLRILDSGFDGQQNLPSYKGSSSKYRGVSESGNKWRAYCRIKGKLHSLGHYENEVEAALVAEDFRKKNMPHSQRDLGL